MPKLKIRGAIAFIGAAAINGVLTSGRGDRVYFSETFIVFTSNLGIYTPGPSGERVANVTPDETFDTVKRKVQA